VRIAYVAEVAKIRFCKVGVKGRREVWVVISEYLWVHLG